MVGSVTHAAGAGDASRWMEMSRGFITLAVVVVCTGIIVACFEGSESELLLDDAGNVRTNATDSRTNISR